jgi:EAL domain-containing protein (putative c-di-GMP-specific phosphodiesterase class I)
VNVSGRQLAEPSLLDDVTRALAQSGLPPARLTLEVTETVLMRDTAQALAALHALKALGVRLAVDDFGTGYSSLSYLRQFPVDVLKIDKSFVDGVARGGHDAALARTIVALAEMLGLRTVAEGVEHEAQRDALGALGCALGQGYLFARPLAADAMRAYVAERVGRGGVRRPPPRRRARPPGDSRGGRHPRGQAAARRSGARPRREVAGRHPPRRRVVGEPRPTVS